MDEQQRELATNRLLEIIRTSKGQPKPTEEPPEPALPAAAAPSQAEALKTPPEPKKPAPSGALSRILQREIPAKTTVSKPPEPEKAVETTTSAKSSPLDKILGKPPSTAETPTLAKPIPLEEVPGKSPAAAETPTVKSTAYPIPAPPTKKVVPAPDGYEIQPIPKSKSTLQRPGGEPTADYEVPTALLPLPQRLFRAFGAKPKAVVEPVEKPVKTKPVKDRAAPKIKPVKGKTARAAAPKGGKRIFALDIGYSSVKVLELTRHGNALRIAALDIRHIPLPMRKSQAGLNILIVKYIREMLPSARLRNAEVRVLLADRSTVYRRASVPSGAVKEIVNAIKFQIKKDLPFGLDTCEISYQGFKPKIKDKQNLEVLAVDGKALAERMGWVEEAEIVPRVITAAAAVNRFLVKDSPNLSAGKNAVLLVDIGASKTTITILENDKLILCRTLAAGGDDFTEALSGQPFGPGNAELNDIQAEKYKFDVGMPTDRDPVSLKVSIQLRPVVERIITEINRSLDFYRSKQTEAEVPKMLLYGGGALMKNLPQFLAENIGIEVIVANPLAWLQADPHSTGDAASLAAEVGPMFVPALAVGLSDGKNFNVLPAKIRGQLRLREIRAVVAPAALGLITLLVLMYANELRREAAVNREFENIQTQVKDLKLYRDRFFASQAEFDKLAAEFAERKLDYESIRIGDPNIPCYLRAISNIVPDNLYLTRMLTTFVPAADENAPSAVRDTSKKEIILDTETVMRNFTANYGNPLAERQDTVKAAPVKKSIFGRVIEMEGRIYPLGTLTDVQLVDFVFALENSGHFRDVAVDSIITLPNGRVHFRVICGI